jgi:hypothetical protein
MDKTLRFWVDAACEHLKRDDPNLTKRTSEKAQLTNALLG